jgi:hypothetical protein
LRYEPPIVSLPDGGAGSKIQWPVFRLAVLRIVTIQQHILSIVCGGLERRDCVYFPPQTGSTDDLDKPAKKF